MRIFFIDMCNTWRNQPDSKYDVECVRLDRDDDVVDHQLLLNVQKLCNLIVNSPAEMPIKGDIESLAFLISHHPMVLNAREL